MFKGWGEEALFSVANIGARNQRWRRTTQGAEKKLTENVAASLSGFYFPEFKNTIAVQCVKKKKSYIR